MISFWKTKAEADRYQEEVFPEALATLHSMIDSGPVIQYFVAVVANDSIAPAMVTLAA